MPRRPHGRTAHHCRCALPPGRCHMRPDPPALGARQRPLSFPRPAGFLARSRVAQPSGAQAARPRRRTCSRTPHSLQACAQAVCTAAKVCAHFRAGEWLCGVPAVSLWRAGLQSRVLAGVGQAGALRPGVCASARPGRLQNGACASTSASTSASNLLGKLLRSQQPWTALGEQALTGGKLFQKGAAFLCL